MNESILQTEPMLEVLGYDIKNIEHYEGDGQWIEEGSIEFIINFKNGSKLYFCMTQTYEKIENMEIELDNQSIGDIDYAMTRAMNGDFTSPINMVLSFVHNAIKNSINTIQRTTIKEFAKIR